MKTPGKTGEQTERFSTVSICDGCGLCCKSLIVEILQSDVDREPRLLPVIQPVRGVSDEQEYILKWYGGRCQMLDVADRCSIHETKPAVCREFEVGGEKCNELREEAGLPRVRGHWERTK